MNLWKKIRMMIFVGLGIFTVSISGQTTDEQPLTPASLIQSEKFLAQLASAIVQEVTVVSGISDFQITDTGKGNYNAKFTVETTEGHIFEGFVCIMNFSFKELSDTRKGSFSSVLSGVTLTFCQSREAVFDKATLSFDLVNGVFLGKTKEFKKK